VALGLGFALPLAEGAERYEPERGDPLLEPWRWRSFPDLNGLSAQCMAEGADGTMWFGTNQGVWRFDGIDWSFFASDQGVPGSVTTLCKGSDDTIYAGGRWGIVRFRGGSWTPFLSASGARMGEIRKIITARDGTLWAVTASGALAFRDSTWTLHTSPEIAARYAANPDGPAVIVRRLPEAVLAKPPSASGSAPSRHDLAAVAEDHQGRLWFATEHGEVLTYTPASSGISEPAGASPEAWAVFNETDGLVCGRRASILPLQDGTVWVVYGIGSGYANIFDGARWRKIRLREVGVPEDCGGAIQTRDGVVWLSGRYVLSAYDRGRWRNYQRPTVPIPTALNFILQASDGAFWIAGPNTEVLRVDYQTPRWLTLQQLNFQGESPDGTAWFLHRDGRVVAQRGDEWISYGPEDGLMDAPVAILPTRGGDVWVAGSHQNTAATARFNGEAWSRHVHTDFSWGIEWRGVMESNDGSVWFSAAVDTSGPPHHRAGLLQFHKGEWRHHHQPGRSARAGADDEPLLLLPATQRPEPIGKFASLGESRDGRIWAGRNILVYQDDQQWNIFAPPPTLRIGVIESMYTTPERELWIGTRQFGALRYDGQRWQSYQGKDSLIANSVRSLVQTTDGSIWAATDRDVSRFDGRTWTANVLPAELNIPHDAGALKAAPSGALWVNRFAVDWVRRAWTKTPPMDTTQSEFWTIRHEFRGVPPETSITAGPSTVSPAGSFSVFWTGASPWRESGQAKLQFSYRLDDQPWSAFTSEPGHSFFSVASGAHRLEVRARDLDFNVDPTPAVLDFVVQPPVWRQDWFIGLMLVCIGLIITQSIRVFLERDRLRQANRDLALAVGKRERTAEALRRLNLELEQRVKARTSQLEAANKELEAFSYSVSHDLRAPLRSIDGFSEALLEDYSARLDDDGKDYLNRVRAAAQRMGRLIDDMLNLSRVTRDEMRIGKVDLSRLAQEIADDLIAREPERDVVFTVAPGAMATGDARFLRIALENLLSNAWKFTSKSSRGEIEFGSLEQDGQLVYFVRDNGAGFDMTYATRLFEAFRRLHGAHEYPGTGVGLAIVQRIIRRHGGRIWAESKVDQGATFYFVIPGAEERTDEPSRSATLRADQTQPV
jgi:signal transduction histidine kinase/ligand-binding sensor domain-containing protein